MHVPEIGGGTVLQALGDDLAQALGRKGVIRQTGQRQPLEADLTTIALRPLPDRGKVLTEAMEDRLDLMKVAMDSMHGVVLADVFAKVQEALRHDVQAKFFQDFAAHGVAQRLAVILSATGENKELSFFGANADREDVFAPQNDRSGGRPDPRGSTTGLATRSGHEATLPRQAGQ
jgi:hypothetical protein